jgi:hypothetical protein
MRGVDLLPGVQGRNEWVSVCGAALGKARIAGGWRTVP